MKIETNFEEKIGKTVGKRNPADSAETSRKIQKRLRTVKEGLGVRGLPRGVYKFKTHEEANEWETRMRIRRNLDQN